MRCLTSSRSGKWWRNKYIIDVSITSLYQNYITLTRAIRLECSKLFILSPFEKTIRITRDTLIIHHALRNRFERFTIICFLGMVVIQMMLCLYLFGVCSNFFCKIRSIPVHSYDLFPSIYSQMYKMQLRELLLLFSLNTLLKFHSEYSPKTLRNFWLLHFVCIQ